MNLSRNLFLLPAITWLGFAIRLYKLGAQSLWYDETVSAFLAGQHVAELVAHTARDIHPPAYYLLLHFWTYAAGQTEFALAFLSLIFGVLLIPLTYVLARRLTNDPTAIWAALLVASSPYHLWYSQEVRMYTLGAGLGLVSAYCLWVAVTAPLNLEQRPGTTTRPFWLGYLISASLGLYTLYYFAFLLIALNLAVLIYIVGARRSTNLFNFRSPAVRSLFYTNSLVVISYLPWLPIFWRQVTQPPVPPWRSADNLALWPILLESWSALSLGQSVEPTTVWPILLLTLLLFLLGLLTLTPSLPLTPSPPHPLTLSPSPTSHPPTLPSSHPLFLLAYTFGPLLMIYLLSFLTPLYHVRYLFTYSPAFYIMVGAGLAWLTTPRRSWLALTAATLLFAAAFFSVYQFHNNPRYRADDYRAAVDFIQTHWQPGDAILVNAGYVYPAFIYYADLPGLERRRLVPYQPPSDWQHPLLLQTGTIGGSPQLGWGDPRADFYAMSAAETVAALEQLSTDFSRLWLLRAYDTVTDPTGLIRGWLAEHTVPLEDELFSGESNIRTQGFLLAGAQPHLTRDPIQFEDGLALAAWSLPDQLWQPGQTIHVKLWWLATSPPSADYKMSLKLWAETGELATQGQDTWPAGTLYRATAWPVGQPVYQPTQITLPETLPAGQYWLNVELYHPETVAPLPRLDGAAPVVTLGAIRVGK